MPAASSLLAAAEEFAAVTPKRRCVMCFEADDDARAVVVKLRRDGFSAARIAEFLARTADSHGHGLRPTGAMIDTHLKAHVDWSADAATQTAAPKSRRRG